MQTKPKFRKLIFWDVDYNKIDYKKYPRYVIGKVVQWGNLSDWKELNSFYPKEKIMKKI